VNERVVDGDDESNSDGERSVSGGRRATRMEGGGCNRKWVCVRRGRGGEGGAARACAAVTMTVKVVECKRLSITRRNKSSSTFSTSHSLAAHYKLKYGSYVIMY
jgi:hypothetical protein